VAGSWPTPDQLVFELIVRLVQGPISGALRAARYQAVMQIPGVTLDSHAIDKLGRPGVGVSMQVPVYGPVTCGFILYANTYSLLGTIWGAFPYGTAVVASGVTLASGSLPAGLPPAASYRGSLPLSEQGNDPR
jgi:hypothetical protein